MLSWEQKMAARAAGRKLARDTIERAEQAREWDQTWAELERQAMAMHAGMPLGEAVRLCGIDRDWVCACMGPPMCCRYPFVQAEALHRGAHIAVKLMTDVMTRREAEDSPSTSVGKPKMDQRVTRSSTDD